MRFFLKMKRYSKSQTQNCPDHPDLPSPKEMWLIWGEGAVTYLFLQF